MIEEKLKKIASEHPFPLVFATVSGAHLYGFPSGDSDYDLRGVHVLPIAEWSGWRRAGKPCSGKKCAMAWNWIW